MKFKKRFNSLKHKFFLITPLLTLMIICSTSLQTDAAGKSDNSTIADFTVAKESVLCRIPESAINNAKSKLRIAYFHSSHGSRIIEGMEGLTKYKTGDSGKWAFTTDGSVVKGKLSIDDHYFSGNDLSVKERIEANGHSEWYNITEKYIRSHPAVNVIMWSWCNPAGHNHDFYIKEMENLIKKHPSITFVFMTGHPNGDGEVSSGNSAYQCFTKVATHCKNNRRFCMDYWSIETRDMNDKYRPFANDDGVEKGDKFYHKWMVTHVEGKDYFRCRCEHTTDQVITGNRIAYASWWLWARIAGWDGITGN